MSPRTIGWYISATAVALIGVTLYLMAASKEANNAKVAYQFEWSTILPVGEAVPDTPIRMAGGTSTLARFLSESWSLVVVTPRLDAKSLEYPAVLADRHRASHFKVLNILSPTQENEAAVLHSLPVGNVQLALDVGRRLGTRLQLPSTGENFVWSLLVAPDGRVRFSTPKFISADALRQLTERFLIGRVNYMSEPQALGYNSGSAMPHMQIERAGTPGVTKSLDDVLPADGTVLFFRAFCTSCGLEGLISQLIKLKKSGVDFEKRHVVPVFSSTFDVAAVAAAVASVPDVPDVFVARAPVPEWEDVYASRPGIMTTPRAVEVDAQHIIRSETNFWIWTGKSEGRATRTVEVSRQGWSAVGLTEGLMFGWIRATATMPNGEWAVLDSKDNRILVFDAKYHLVRQVGVIGQDAGDLYRPQSFSSGGGRFTIADQDGLMVKELEYDGRPRTQFSFPYVTDSVAVLDDGSTYINSPRNETIAARVDARGGVVGRVGELIEVADGFPDRANSPSMRTPLSRAWLRPTSDGRLVAAFQFAPLVRKYSLEGTVLWQALIAGDGATKLAATLWHKPGAPVPSAVKSIDGIQLPPIITAVSGDDRGRTWVALGDGSLTLLSPDGRQLGTIAEASMPPGKVFYSILIKGPDIIVCSSDRCFQRPLEDLASLDVSFR